jgi:glycosyltransferase involved in cell wall biosynthesis
VTRDADEPWNAPPPRRRSIVFLHHCYYNFLYLAQALRKRGWYALSVIVDPPTNPDLRFGHGEDVNLYDPDPQRFRQRIERFVHHVKHHVAMVHFYGRGRMSFYPEHWDTSHRYDRYPWDFIALKRRGVKIGYSHSGCLDMVSQTSFRRWSGGCCDRCVWEDRPDVCSDLGNLAWGHKVQQFCDLICIEADPVLDFKSGPKLYREPLTFAVDPNVWHPDLVVPDGLRLPRRQGETIVYHAVGNLATRSSETRNIKGTPAIMAAVERLRQEGHRVRLEFVKDIPSRDVRFVQVQADVIVDQLNYGRYGATAREGMMLGKPTVCFINPREEVPGTESQCIQESPLVSATEATIFDTLKTLVVDPDRRRRIGEASREHAIKWWSSDLCAERFEAVFDRLTNGLYTTPAPPTPVSADSAESPPPEPDGGRLLRWIDGDRADRDVRP